MAMRAVLAVGFCVVSTGAYAACDTPDVQASAAGWNIRDTGRMWVARSDAYPELEVPLHMASPGQPVIFEFVTLPRYQNRIALLQYYAGDPGTSYFVTLVHNAILDLDTGAVLGDAPFTEDCERTEWSWYDDRVEVVSAYGLDVVKLNWTPEPVMLDEDTDHGTCSTGFRVNSGGADLRAGPGDHFPLIAILPAGLVIAGCDFREGWEGIIDGRDESCSIGISVTKRTPYSGPCRSGWIKQNFLTQIHG